MEKVSQGNPLGYENIGKLILRYAIPSAIGMLTGALYNIADQIFIGHSAGYLGNAATNVDFPIAVAGLAVALTFGIGGAAGYSLSLGAGDRERAVKIVGNAVFWLVVCGLALFAAVRLLLRPILVFLGATEEVLPYSLDYSGITCLGLPFAMLSAAVNHLIRADGRPKLSMLCMISGCALNIALDPLLIFSFGMGIRGAAIATVFSQAVSCLLGLFFICRMKNVKLTLGSLKPDLRITLLIMKLGVASFVNHISNSVVQIVLNNVLTKYGAQSEYGPEIPLAVAGIVTKTNMLFFSIVVGISQGCQPAIGFNYGAKQYSRVRRTLNLGLIAATCVSVLSFACYQLFPGYIIRIFGGGDELYVDFAVRYFRIFLMFAFINGIQPLCSNFFTSIGKAFMGVFISMTRQYIFFIPLVFMLPMVFGVNGVMYSGPVADCAAMSLAVIFVVRELKKIKKLEAAD